jgi:hypothetical protein
MSAGWKSLYTENDSLTIDLSEDDLDDLEKGCSTDTIVRLKEVITGLAL